MAKKRKVAAAPGFILFFVGLFSSVSLAGPMANGLLEAVRDQHRANTIVGEYSVDIVRPDWKRHIELHSVEDQQINRYQAEVMEPRKLRGTMFFKAGKRLWMYMPKLRRTVSISPSMMLEPWMGSDLTNQDLLQQDSIADDYEHRLVERDSTDGHEIWTIESLPRPGIPVVWGRLVQTIRDDAVPVRVDYYDRAERLVRRIEFSDMKQFGERVLPTTWRIIPQPPAGSYTELHLESVQFDAPLPANSFENMPASSAPAEGARHADQ
ncbi:MAG: outer membrane lipoprotein-sorting protein [Pseudomonadota bacterium]